MLFAFFDLIDELEDVGRGGYNLRRIVIYVLLSMPVTSTSCFRSRR